MAKIKNPTTFSEYFGIDGNRLNKLGVFDPTLEIDTRLFIDPLLLQNSKHPEINTQAVNQYRSHFEKIIKFLEVTNVEGDVPWRTALRLLEFHEIRGTCLGYVTCPPKVVPMFKLVSGTNRKEQGYGQEAFYPRTDYPQVTRS